METKEWKDMTYRELAVAHRQEGVRVGLYYGTFLLVLVWFEFLWGTWPKDLLLWIGCPALFGVTMALQKVRPKWLRLTLLWSALGAFTWMYWTYYLSKAWD